MQTIFDRMCLLNADVFPIMAHSLPHVLVCVCECVCGGSSAPRRKIKITFRYM